MISLIEWLTQDAPGELQTGDWIPSLPGMKIKILDDFCDRTMLIDKTISEAELTFEDELRDYLKRLDDKSLAMCIDEIENDILKTYMHIKDTRTFLEECAIAGAMLYLKLEPTDELEKEFNS